MKYRKHSNELDKLKKWFLDAMLEKDYDKETIRNYENFMYRIRSFEVKYTEPKLVQDYNYNDIILLLKSLGSSSKESLYIYIGMIRRFFDFCIEQGQMDDNIDYIRTIDTTTLEKCIDKRKNKHRYITEKELQHALDSLINDIDKAFLLMIFEGFSGKENSDIINLKTEDIDFENNVVRINLKGGEFKEIIISDELLDLLKSSSEEYEIYTSNNYEGKVDKLIHSDYVFRPSIRYLNLKATMDKIEKGEYDGTRLDTITLTSRIFKSLKVWNNLNYVTPNTLFKSGMVNRAIKALGLEASKKEYSEWIAENEGYSICVAYKTYPIYKEIVTQIQEEREEQTY